MTSVSTLADLVDVVIGVDTHVETHSACAVRCDNGAVLDRVTVPTTPAGYRQLVEFADAVSADAVSADAGTTVAVQGDAEGVGDGRGDGRGEGMGDGMEPAVIALRAWAIEGTGAHGAGLTRVLDQHQEVVFELDRPQRAKRRNGKKSDPLDAERAAREALARPRLGTPRAGDGDRQVLAQLLSARASAVQGATDAQRQLFSWVVAAPDQIRDRLRGRRRTDLLRAAARMRGHATWKEDTQMIAETLATVAKRALALIEEANHYQNQIRRLVRRWRPDLLEETGIGPIVAATVLCAWSHPGRIHSEAGFAMLAGTAPIPANSGQTTTRYRLNPYGDRRLNHALHTIVSVRQRCHQPTQTYTEKRTTQGKTKPEIRRCLKRYIIRDLYRILENPKTPTQRVDAT
jgi:transposase